MKAKFFVPLFAALLLASHNQCTRSHTGLPFKTAYKNRVVIKVHEVQPAADTLETEVYRDMLQRTFVEDPVLLYSADSISVQAARMRRLECFSRDRRPLISARNNGFFEAVHRAYAQHRRLVITPDMVWLTIAQGFARHISINSESMRKHFVRHEGKKPLVVDMTGRVRLGSDNSDWEWAFAQFQDSVAANTNQGIAETIAGRFSGTDSDAAVAFNIALMDAMEPYFDYWGDVACGIPEIVLEGSPEDWQQVERRAAALGKYELDWWMQDLKPILTEFTRSAQGNPNPDFWKSIIRDLHDFGCGARSDTFLTGWIVKLFPYILKNGEWQKNPILGLKIADLYTVQPENQPVSPDAPPNDFYRLCTDQKTLLVDYTGPKVTLADIPPGVFEVILNVNNNGNFLKMELKAGFFGMRQDSGTQALRPVIGWAIVDTGAQPDPEVMEGYLKNKKNN